MNIGLALATFAIVIPAELPDKTFIAGIVLSARYRPLPVWIGTAGGLIVQALIGALAGRLIALAPHRVVAAIVAGAFVGGSLYLFFVAGRSSERAGHEIAQTEEERLEHAERGPSAARIALTSFGIVTLAEFGDLTQVVITNLSARSRDPLSVFVGAAAGFILVSGLGVAAGRTITRVVPLHRVRQIAAVALLGLGIWSALGAAGVIS